jgi:hypothetical protein
VYTDNELFFPPHVIASLANLRGEQWQALVRRVVALPETHEEKLAFMLMMVRINGCVTCETDSYRAMRGCTACTLQTLRRYRGSDESLLEAYDKALAEIRQFARESHPLSTIIQRDE